MSQIESIDWFWNHGKSFTKIIYDDGRIEPRQNHEIPPTDAAHDIAHFICAFHKDLEWDYILDPPDIAEFNAVFVENLLGSFSYHYYNNLDIDLNETCDAISAQMKWFAHEHYKIHIHHPSKKRYPQLKNDFFEYVDFNILVRHFNSFYQPFVLQRLVNSKEFDLSIKMNRTDKYEFDLLDSYLNRISKALIHRDN